MRWLDRPFFLAADAAQMAQRWRWRLAKQKSLEKKARALRLEKAALEREEKKKKTPNKWRKVIAFDAKQSYNDRRQREFNRLQKLETWSRAPRNLDEVQTLLVVMAKKVGQIYGVFLSVGRRDDNLVFVNEAGEDIVDPGGVGNPASSVMCAAADEIDSGDFLKLFAARSLYAALTVRFNQIDHGVDDIAGMQ